MSAHPTPTVPGFFWAKWRHADEGTDECQNCGHKHSDWEETSPMMLTDWEPVEVFENCLDETNAEYLRASVPGVSRSQSIENFVWGPAIERYAG